MTEQLQCPSQLGWHCRVPIAVRVAAKTGAGERADLMSASTLRVGEVHACAEDEGMVTDRIGVEVPIGVELGI